MSNYTIRPLNSGDKDWVTQFMVEHWGSEIAIVHGTIYHPAKLPGFAAMQKNEIAGLITYQIEREQCEIVSINSLKPGLGIGTALIEAVKNIALTAGCSRLWLITTNDNLHALGFYQKRGFALVAVHRNAVDVSRKIKPEIPLLGNDGIPLRDELELEMMLADSV